MAAQWKIIHQFKPTEYKHNQGDHPPPDVPNSLKIMTLDHMLCIKFPIPNIALHVLGLEPSKSEWLENDQLPKVGEWTKIEIGHEKAEDGKYYLSLAVGDKEVKKEVEHCELWKMEDVKIVCGGRDWCPIQPGSIRGLVVCEKE